MKRGAQRSRLLLLVVEKKNLINEISIVQLPENY